jgi:hypothetical protein
MFISSAMLIILNQHMNNLNISTCNYENLRKIHESLFKPFALNETIQISRQEREVKNLTTSNFTYGELEFEGTEQILSKVKQEFGNDFLSSKQSFVDLGCGIGKAVVSFALLGSFEKCSGIEILENIHSMALLIKEQYDSKINKTEIEFICKDLNEYDFTGQDFVFTNSTCWNTETLNTLSYKVEKLKTGAIFVNTDQPVRLINPHKWLKITPFNVTTSWGYARTFIMRRL